MLKPYINDFNLYLQPSNIIDFNNEEIVKVANEIEGKSNNKIDYIKNAYEYVRDNISHSTDINSNAVTCEASTVLNAGHGICFAKSHLLTALLRCKSIPSGLCYQKLILDDETNPVLVLHGLNGVYIEECGKWIRLDARGNRQGVNAQFSIETEILAYPVRSEEKGEEDIMVVYPEPDRNVVDALQKCETRTKLWRNLPRELIF